MDTLAPAQRAAGAHTHSCGAWWTGLDSRGHAIRSTGWKYSIAASNPDRSQRSVPRQLAGLAGEIGAVARRMQRVSLECQPALDIVASYGDRPGVLLYLDPPYVAATRNGTNYAHEMPGADEHRELADALRNCRAAVVLSGYPSPLYDELYEGWYREQASASTGNGRAGERARVEVLWSNRPLGAQGVLDFEAGAA